MSSTQAPNVTARALLPLYHTLVAARRIDELERQFTNRGEAFFHVAGFGHGATAALAPHLGPQDWLHCHYRDKALMLARGMTAEDFFLALFCKKDSHSRGRQMSAHMCAPSLNILSVVGPVGNNALQAAGIASAVKERAGQPLVVCCVGDGTTQEGEVLEAIAESVRSHLPVLWLVEDNYFAISTRTAGKTFYSLPTGLADEFMGIPISYLDGASVQACYAAFGKFVGHIRETRAPRIAVLRTERLDDHTNADDQTVYRTAEEISTGAGTGDPLVMLAGDLLQLGVSQPELDNVAQAAREEVELAAERAKRADEPTACADAKSPLPRELMPPRADGPDAPVDAPLTMLESMRRVLRAQLAADSDVQLYGQDIDDPKGDVFGLTRGLGSAFPEQVENAPLTESTIVGVSIGRALAGKRPVAFLQFADFIPLAFNQIAAELSSIYWRTDGGWQAPVIVMAVCGGYKAGLGPFHAQTLESIVAHIPGLDVMMPSNAEDAAGLLNAAFASRRPTIFLYPKSCLNDRSLATREVPEQLIVSLGSARTIRRGTELTIVGWGGTVPLCVAAAQHLHAAGISAEVIDLRCISPWDESAILASAERTGNLIVAHEDNRSVGFGAEVLATVAEKVKRSVRVRRVTRADTHIPCNFGNQLEILPSAASIVEAAAELLGLEIETPAAHPEASDPHVYVVDAFGTSPSDEQITILQWFVEAGKDVNAGDKLAEVEADKAAGELDAPVSGRIEEILASAGDTVRIGSPLLRIRTPEPRTSGLGQMHVPNRPLPVVKRSVVRAAEHSSDRSGFQVMDAEMRRSSHVYLSHVYAAQGSEATTNAELAARFPELSEEEIFRKIGIESRCRAAKGETALTLAMRAVDACYDADPNAFQHLDLIVCATSSISQVCPSIACSILAELNRKIPGCRAPAFDVLATCTGFLYALQIAHGLIKASPQSRALVVTAETLSPLLDPNNAATCIGFGDAATACIVGGDSLQASAPFEVLRPNVHAKGDGEKSLTVPPMGTGDYIRLEGRRLRQESLPALSDSLREVCRAHGIAVADLRYVVAHQANQRVLNELGVDLGIPPEKVFSNIRLLGNTSSSTIPLCLRDLDREAKLQPGDLLGLTAFGGGFTYGAALLKANTRQ